MPFPSYLNESESVKTDQTGFFFFFNVLSTLNRTSEQHSFILFSPEYCKKAVSTYEFPGLILTFFPKPMLSQGVKGMLASCADFR